MYAPLVRQYGRMYAQWSWRVSGRVEQDFLSALTERWSEEEKTTHSKGGSRKRTAGQRTLSAWDAYDRALARLITLVA